MADYLVIMPLGWLIVALASTLGAPFWFDALSKLVRLRGTGGRTETPPAAADGTTSSVIGKGLLTPASSVEVPAEGSKPIAMSDALNDAERALTSPEVQRVQRGLDMQEVEVSGWFDGTTRRAIKAWQQAHQFEPATGELSAYQINELLAMRTTNNRAPEPAETSAAGLDNDDCADGCDVAIESPTPDAELPEVRGGVAETIGV